MYYMLWIRTDFRTYNEKMHTPVKLFKKELKRGPRVRSELMDVTLAASSR